MRPEEHADEIVRLVIHRLYSPGSETYKKLVAGIAAAIREHEAEVRREWWMKLRQCRRAPDLAMDRTQDSRS